MDKSSYRVVALLSLAIALLSSPLYSAQILVDGNNTQLFVGSTGLPAVVYGFDATNAAIPSTFSNNFFVKGDGTASSTPITFSSAPTTYLGGMRYFVFVLDAQEPGSNQAISLDNMSISVNNVTIWSTTDTLLLNSRSPLTLTPQGNGADMAFYIPVAVFNNLGLTGSSTFVFTVTQSQSSGGNEEWEFTDRGIPTAITFFAPGETIVDVVVPEPSTTVLAFSSLLALAGFAKYRMKA